MTAAFQNLQASSWGRMGVRRSWSVDRAGFVFYHCESARRHWNTAWQCRNSAIINEGRGGKRETFWKVNGYQWLTQWNGVEIRKEAGEGRFFLKGQWATPFSRLFCLLMLHFPDSNPIHTESPTDPSKTLTGPILSWWLQSPSPLGGRQRNSLNSGRGCGRRRRMGEKKQGWEAWTLCDSGKLETAGKWHRYRIKDHGDVSETLRIRSELWK